MSAPASAAAALTVEVRYFAGAAAAAGRESERLDLAAGADLADLLQLLRSRHPQLEAVLAVASLLVDEVAGRPLDTPLRPGAQVDVLPPFAGG